MRTLQQIRWKVLDFKKKLSKRTVYENFGDKEERELDEYIGDIYEYDFYKRQQIIDIKLAFFKWCVTCVRGKIL